MDEGTKEPVSGSGEDVLLVRAFQGGDKEAFDKLVLKHKDRLFNLCYRYLGDYEEANDSAQDTFLKAYGGLGDYPGGPEIAARFDYLEVPLIAKCTWVFRERRSLSVCAGASFGALVQAEFDPEVAADASDVRAYDVILVTGIGFGNAPKSGGYSLDFRMFTGVVDNDTGPYETYSRGFMFLATLHH